MVKKRKEMTTKEKVLTVASILSAAALSYLFRHQLKGNFIPIAKLLRRSIKNYGRQRINPLMLSDEDVTILGDEDGYEGMSLDWDPIGEQKHEINMNSTLALIDEINVAIGSN